LSAGRSIRVPHFSQLTLSAGVSVTVTLYLAPQAHLCVPVSHSTNSVMIRNARYASEKDGYQRAPTEAALLRLAVNKFAVNLSSTFVDNKYFKVLIVPQAVIAEVLRHFFAVLDCLRICLELDADAVPIRDAVFHIEKELFHGGPRLQV
jgi:hypothetical protein